MYLPSVPLRTSRTLSDTPSSPLHTPLKGLIWGVLGCRNLPTAFHLLRGLWGVGGVGLDGVESPAGGVQGAYGEHDASHDTTCLHSAISITPSSL